MDFEVHDFQGAPYQSSSAGFSRSKLLAELQGAELGWEYLAKLKEITSFSDDVIAEWLSMNVKTFRAYKQPQTALKPNLREHALMLLRVFNHGAEVFGSYQAFDTWLAKPHFIFDHKPPLQFLNTITGIQFIDDELTAMAFGHPV